MTPTKHNLGCGRKKLEGCINVDCVKSVEPDVLHDLDVHPYPFGDNAFDEIFAYDVVEHLEDLVGFMHEVWRIARPDAVLRIATPHFSCANSYMDPTHRRHLSYFSFDYFTAGHPWSFYGSSGFAIRRRQIVFVPSLVNRVVSRLARRYPEAYEQRWAWIFPAWFLSIDLVARKP